MVDSGLESKLTELYHLVVEIEEKSKRKTDLKNELIELIKENGLKSKKFSIGNRTIYFKMEKQQEGLSQKLLLNALKSYYGDNKNEALKVFKYILGQREQKVREMLDIKKK